MRGIEDMHVCAQARIHARTALGECVCAQPNACMYPCSRVHVSALSVRGCAQSSAWYVRVRSTGTHMRAMRHAHVRNRAHTCEVGRMYVRDRARACACTIGHTTRIYAKSVRRMRAIGHMYRHGREHTRVESGTCIRRAVGHMYPRNWAPVLRATGYIYPCKPFHHMDRGSTFMP